MPVLLAVAGPRAGTRFAFERDILVGRASDCHVRVMDGRASRRHARFVIDEDGVRVDDLGSRNGTQVNGQRIAAPTLIAPGDRIRVGETVLVFEPNVDLVPARHTGGAVVLDDAAPESAMRVQTSGRVDALPGDAGPNAGVLAVRLAVRLAPQVELAGVATAGLEETAAVLRADRGVLLLAERGERLVSPAAVVGAEEVVVDRSVVRRVLLEGDALLYDSEARELLLGPDEPLSTGARVVLAAPLRGMTAPIGLIVLERRRKSDEELPWDAAALDALGVAGALVGATVERVRHAAALVAEIASLSRGGPQGEPFIVGDGPRLRELLDDARGVARTERPVLIAGEVGSGRSLIARYVHEHSTRAEGPLGFLACGVVDRADHAAALFGEERDPADPSVGRVGALESSHGGTLYLEDVDRLSEDLRSQLRSTLRDGMLVRVGGIRPVPVDVRLVASSGSGGRAVAQNLLGAGAVALTVPALRERLDDLSLLFSHFAEEAARALGRDRPIVLSPEGRRAAEAYSWPGNVRELKNLVERLTLLDPPGASVGPADLPREGGALPVDTADGSLAERVAGLEAAAIARALEEEGGRKVRVARRLGISRPTLDRKIALYRLRWPRS
jgi:DNA-binding NtrC family response regulator/pSer/pThr/pTyr-binding forkhead associated (FHA) protein